MTKPIAQQRRRNLSKERFWKRKIETWQRSGLSIRTFCKRNDCAESTFSWWKRELERRDADGVSEKRARQNESRDKQAAETRFVPLRVIEDSTVFKVEEDRRFWSTDGGIEIVLPGGQRIRIQPGFDAMTLGRVLSVLEGRTC